MSEEKENFDNQLNQLIKGELISDNPYVNHALDKFREKSAEAGMAKQRYDQARAIANQSEIRIIALDSECTSLRDDIQCFYKLSMKEDEEATTLDEGTAENVLVEKMDDEQPEIEEE
jgi:hypothetical protein